MNVFCYVVDAVIAGKVIVSQLKKYGLLDGALIAERHDDEAKVLLASGLLRYVHRPLKFRRIAVTLTVQVPSLIVC